MKTTVPIFFSCDKNYVPFLSVAIRSLIDNSSKDNLYNIYILTDIMLPEFQESILPMQTENVKISLVNVRERLSELGDTLHLRDYYTVSIYFRLFIASMFPELDKAIYLDADLVVLDDIANLYNRDIEDNILGVVPDTVVSGHKVLHSYVDDALGIEHESYFNSGMLLMNLAAMREHCIEKTFIEMFNKYHFETVAPDQDYLNFLCNGKVYYLEREWNVMWSKKKFTGTPKIVHYNMFKKPWIYANVPFEDEFWKYAIKTPYYGRILAMKKRFMTVQRVRDYLAMRKMLKKSREIASSEITFSKIKANV